MAKYINYTPDVFGIQETHEVKLWKLPQQFSQSRLGDRVIGSNACTLIALLLAGRIDEYRISLWGYIDQPLSRMLVTSLAEAIVDGNEIYEELEATNALTHAFLNIPEALEAVRPRFPCLVEWADRSITVFTPLGESFVETIEPPMFDWTNNPPPNKKLQSDLYIVLICKGRSVLFVYQPQLGKITLVDSHTHAELNSGAIVAQVQVAHLNEFCRWFCDICELCLGQHGRSITPFELAFLYVFDPYL